MEETLEKENPPSEVKLSNEGGIRLRLRDRDLLKKRKAEAEEKATNQWVYGAQSLKRARKRSSGTPGRKGRPRKHQPVVIPEDFSEAQEIDPTSVTLPITLPVLSTVAETATLEPAELQPAPVSVETVREKPLKTFFIEDLGPDEEEDLPSTQKRLVIDTGDAEQRADAPVESHVLLPAFPPATAPSYPESLPENLPEPFI